MKLLRRILTIGLSLVMVPGAESAMLYAQAAPPSGEKKATTATAPKATTPAATTPVTTATAAAAPAAKAPAAADAEEEEKFSKEQLEQLIAPIALYSDALLMQVLMSATYPIEIVEADRFMKKNPGLKGEKLEAELKEQDWDPSVKSMCTLPDVLKRMSENLDWTQDLGDAFLGQKDELLDTAQIMRGKAHASGNLKTSEEQVVTVKEDKIIVIESPNPEVVYVPTYSPSVVYGGWSYPYYYYPPMYPYYPYGAGFVAFGVGIAVGAAIWGGVGWGWGRHHAHIDHHRYNNFNRNTNINHNNLSGNRGNWNHNASHRKGVGYQNQSVARQHGAQSGANRVSQGQAQARGRSGSAGAGTGQARSPSASSASRQGSAGQASASRGQTSGTKARSSASSYGSGSGRSSAYSGYGSSSSSRASSYRGSYSRGGSSYGGSYGGMRGGGMRGGGGRRR